MLLILSLGFVTGIKHAFEPDHIIAVSTLVHRERSMRTAVQLGVNWGLGHTTMLGAGALCISLLSLRLSDGDLILFELPVGLMLLVLGGAALYDVHLQMRAEAPGPLRTAPEPAHRRRPENNRRMGWRSYGVGLVHGLAGSGALMLLAATTLPTTASVVAYVLLFGAGSAAGMGLISLVLLMPFLAGTSNPWIYRALTGFAGFLSLSLGLLVLREALSAIFAGG